MLDVVGKLFFNLKINGKICYFPTKLLTQKKLIFDSLRAKTKNTKSHEMCFCMPENKKRPTFGKILGT